MTRDEKIAMIDVTLEYLGTIEDSMDPDEFEDLADDITRLMMFVATYKIPNRPEELIKACRDLAERTLDQMTGALSNEEKVKTKVRSAPN